MFYKAHDPSVTTVGTIFSDVEIPRYSNEFVWYVVLHHVSVIIVAISAQFSLSISDSYVIFCTTDPQSFHVIST